MTAKSDKTAGGSGGRPTEATSSHNGLFDDDDEDLFAPAASKPAAANKKGSSQFELPCPDPVLLLIFRGYHTAVFISAHILSPSIDSGPHLCLGQLSTLWL